MKTSTKVLIGLGIAAGVTAVLAVGIIRELKANGMDDIVAEVQTQLDAWRAANGK